MSVMRRSTSIDVRVSFHERCNDGPEQWYLVRGFLDIDAIPSTYARFDFVRYDEDNEIAEECTGTIHKTAAQFLIRKGFFVKEEIRKFVQQVMWERLEAARRDERERMNQPGPNLSPLSLL